VSKTTIETRVSLNDLHRAALRLGKIARDGNDDAFESALSVLEAALGVDAANILAMAGRGYVVMLERAQAKQEEIRVRADAERAADLAQLEREHRLES
jgi:hypothetical protein